MRCFGKRLFETSYIIPKSTKILNLNIAPQPLPVFISIHSFTTKNLCVLVPAPAKVFPSHRGNGLGAKLHNRAASMPMHMFLHRVIFIALLGCIIPHSFGLKFLIVVKDMILLIQCKVLGRYASVDVYVNENHVYMKLKFY